MRTRGIKASIAAVLVLCLFLLLCTQTVYAATLLKKGMENRQVLLLQTHLAQLGFFDVEPTGYYGEITETAVKDFQRAYGLDADGIAGPDTLSRIDEIINNKILKKGMEGDEVAVLQSNLKELGYFDTEVTGYFGEITEQAVKRLQEDHGLYRDGIAGRKTFTLINSLLFGVEADVSVAARSTERNKSYMTHWNEVSQIFTRGTTARVIDIKTGLSFNVKRTYGDTHSDTETLTLEDTEIMKRVYGGNWSWEKRAIIVEVNNLKFAASMNGMPHAGLDGYNEGAYVNSRSGGYGYGYNHDMIKGNGMDGHFCIHFYGSKLHLNNQVDPTHQEMVRTANEWALRNFED